VFPYRRLSQNNTDEDPSIRKTELNRYTDLQPVSNSQDRFSEYERSFLSIGVCRQTASDFSKRLVLDYSKKDLASPRLLKRVKTKIVSTYLRTMSPKKVSAQPSWVAIGISGSGKTSLLVKLALSFKMRNQPVSLVSVDKRKILGARELATYAKLINVPFYTEDHLRSTTSTIQLIDCPALDLSNSGQAEELERVCDGRPVCVVLDGTSRLNEILRILNRTRRFNPQAIAFTRLDLISQQGVILDAIRKSRLPLLGASIGQSFQTPFKYFETLELAQFILKNRGML